MPFRFWDVRTALPGVFETAVAGLDDVAVYDGPRAKGATKQRYIVVGAIVSPEGEPAGDGGAASHEWSTMGPGERQEVGTIPCTVIAWHGSTRFGELREAVAAIVDACETALVADPTLGGVLDDLHEADLTGVTVAETQTTKGAAVTAVFTVTYGTQSD